MTTNSNFRIDSLLPQEIAVRAEEVGVKKAGLSTARTLMLGMLAGSFIALGAIFATTIATGGGALPYGLSKLLTGLVFSLGLILVVVGGAELFTGNNLIVMAWVSRKISTGALVRNWVLVYIGNFIGAIATAVLLFVSRQYTFNDGAVGQTALNIANGKVNLDFVQAIALGMLCNALVCLAVWLAFGAHTTTDKILAILFPITAFVAAGFEHSIANMYFIPMGLFIKDLDASFAQATELDLSALTWGNFLVRNLLPVTIGNIIGGGVMVAGVYWFIYLRERHSLLTRKQDSE